MRFSPICSRILTCADIGLYLCQPDTTKEEVSKEKSGQEYTNGVAHRSQVVLAPNRCKDKYFLSIKQIGKTVIEGPE